MTRSSKKGPYVDERLMKKVLKLIENGGKLFLKTWSRACAIHPKFIGFTFAVHNGKDHVPVFITENMVGMKLGDFALTRKWRGHGGNKK